MIPGQQGRDLIGRGDRDSSRGGPLVYKVNLTYSAPTACSTQWTTTTAVAVTPPYEIARHLAPKYREVGVL
jgi:hypothetical protein